MDVYPTLPLDPPIVQRLIGESNDWAASNGFVMRSAADKRSSKCVQPCPYALLPTVFPRRLYDQAAAVQKTMNVLYHRVSSDGALLHDSLAQVAQSDEFTKQLLSIYDTVYEHAGGRRDGMCVPKLVLMRADYMADSPCQRLEQSTLKQIEVNLMAASFAGLATKCSAMHAHTLSWPPFNMRKATVDRCLFAGDKAACDTVAAGLTAAYECYRSEGDRAKVVLFVVEHENQNALDQRHLEYALNRTGIRCVMMTLPQCDAQLTVGEQCELLLQWDSDRDRCEVAVVYFRVGYVPSHYPTLAEWRARRTIERSRAIKAPCLPQQLANMKKLQQVLCKDDVLRTLLEDGVESQLVAATFAPQYGLEWGERSGDDAVAAAIAAPEHYVLKPQLEGGGNNLYGQHMADALQRMHATQRAAYILMHRIQPFKGENYLVRPGVSMSSCSQLRDTVSELGIYGYLLATGSHIVANEAGGHVLRTKAVGVDEGGIMAGASVIDCPFLV